MKNISEFRIEYYGNSYLKDLEDEFYPNVKIQSLPCALSFNSAWRLIHECAECSKEVKFIDSGERNYKTIKNINSKYREYNFLVEVCKMFPSLEIIELDNISYVNRIDFNYEYDMQRKQSVELKHHCCEFCKSDYLSIIRIGYPLEREKGNLAKLGKLNVIQITHVMKDHLLTKEPEK